MLKNYISIGRFFAFFLDKSRLQNWRKNMSHCTCRVLNVVKNESKYFNIKKYHKTISDSAGTLLLNGRQQTLSLVLKIALTKCYRIMEIRKQIVNT